MNFVIENCFLFVVCVAVAVGSIMFICRFLKMPSTAQLDMVREWLLFAVTQTEKELGAGTGKLKLRYVYDLFVVRFTWIAKVISFEQFTHLVDDALEEMKKLLNNQDVAKYVKGVEG